MSGTRKYDAIVIGSGQGGTPLCQALAEAGLRTALVEREHVGGTCVNEGCTPSKTMVASGRVAYLVRRAAAYGINTEAARVNMARVRKRKRDIVESFRGASERRIESTPNLDLIAGEASFTSPKEIVVDPWQDAPLTLSAERFFINAGCRPAVPDLEGFPQIPFLDSTSIMELDTVPQHLLVLGGGYVGLEFGQLFRRLGSEVTIIHSGSQLLAREDADVAQAVQAILQQDGIHVMLQAKAGSVQLHGSRVHLMVGDEEQSDVKGSHLLVATGRVPNTDLLNLPAAGVATDSHGYIVVNDRLETNVKGIYALGDIKGGPAFTHISYDDFRVIRRNLLEGGSASIAGRLVPYTVFIDPQLGRVGLTETEARAHGRRLKVAKMPMSYVARALEMDETRGFLKAVVDAESGEILGAAALGIDGGEIAAQLQIAMMGRLPYTALRDAVFSHPNLAEALNNLFYHFMET
ncbi:mercuric reductase [Geomonas sp. RF6]|uniref:mercuric reductase n=1 Tax=Geomonas sp. RF6 TaxID=2897342 RepID=UPI001E3AD99B|nr:mercuric reductase [Geomonas sp. RF6]UFS72230.1 mercuric reductase [Geomonas sp. RF6]